MSENTITPIKDEHFEEEVLNSDKPVLIDFWAPWCQPCQMMGPVLEEIARKHGNYIKFLKINVSENQVIAGELNIMGIPTLVLFEDGQEQQRLVGLQTLEQLESILTEISKDK